VGKVASPSVRRPRPATHQTHPRVPLNAVTVPVLAQYPVVLARLPDVLMPGNY